ncbi:hypothetical protein GOV04_02995 [Candidatus Woesearchaeota archaeon]|nr:hypothetical protein [Candidatus Woesearchaeota archaeon]
MVTVKGSIYEGVDGRILGLGTYFRSELPEELKKILTTVARLKYKVTRHGKTDLLLVNHAEDPEELMHVLANGNGNYTIFRHVSAGGDLLHAMANNINFLPEDPQYTPESKIIGQRELDDLIEAALLDIGKHAIRKNKPKNAKLPTKHPKKVQSTKTAKIGGLNYLTDGKGAFHDGCLLRLNLDFSNVCLGGCDYCYAKRHNRGRPFQAKSIDSQLLDEDLINGLQVDYSQQPPVYNPELDPQDFAALRLGKRTDPGHQRVHKQLMTTLEVLADHYKISTIMPTKMLPFNPAIAKLLQQARVHLAYSISPWQHLERGAVSEGFDTKTRLELARDYQQAGVNTSLKVIADITTEPDNLTKKRISEAIKDGLPIQLIPIRPQNKAMTPELLGGHHWEDFKGDHSTIELFENLNHQSGDYAFFNNKPLPTTIHPYWQENKITICGELVSANGTKITKSYCDDCNLK